MMTILLRDLSRRLWIVAVAALLFYLLEPAFHQHGPAPADLAAELGPLGLSATLANLAGLSMVILLAGFISGDRRHGYYRLHFSHPTSPLALYGLRWGLALLLSLLVSVLFLLLGQAAAWGEIRGGLPGLLLALLSAVAYGGLMAFLSAILPRGDALVAVLLFIATYVWLTATGLGAEPLTPALRDVVTFLLPPMTALQDVYGGIVTGEVVWDAAAFAAGYGLFWLVVAGVLVRVREWP